MMGRHIMQLHMEHSSLHRITVFIIAHKLFRASSITQGTGCAHSMGDPGFHPVTTETHQTNLHSTRLALLQKPSENKLLSNFGHNQSQTFKAVNPCVLHNERGFGAISQN